MIVKDAFGENIMADEELPVIAKFEVRRRAYLAPDGAILRDLPNFAADQNLIVSMYRGTRAHEAAPIPASSDADRPAPAGSAALRLLADVDISF